MPRVFDIETDGLLDEVTKIHVLAWTDDGENYNYTHDYDEMRAVLTCSDELCGHYIIPYDIPVVENILGVTLSKKTTLIDTWALSHVIHHNRNTHGLEGYGEDYGIPKPEVPDWKNLTQEEYRHRCIEDVKINWRLWKDLEYKLKKLYSGDEDGMWRFVRYISFKMSCVADQEDLKFKLDVDRTKIALEDILNKQGAAVAKLIEVMPKIPVYKTLTKPKVMYKKDGSLSSHGERWVELCKEHKQPQTTQSFVIIGSYKESNPNSSDQVKAWLDSYGWVPKTFKFVRKDDGTEKMIPQIRKDGELCESVKDLIEVEPDIAYLDGLTVLQHRAGILKSFLEYEKDGYVKATVSGFTNTLRFRHAKPLVNLPGVDKPYGDVIRGVLICDPDERLCGSDMTSLEDTTKRHYIQPLDPEYVAEMQKPGFDPHLDLAVFAGAISRDDYNDYARLDKADTMTDQERTFYKRIKRIRKAYKTVNYSATYGVGAAKLARETGLSVSEAKALLEAFWKRNWAIKAVASKIQVRELFGSMWLKNPVSGFWYSLRSEKDIFSTLNQSTGVYCFDKWLAIVKGYGVKVIAQFHDEWIGKVLEGNILDTEVNVKDSIVTLNEQLNLNVPLGCDIQFGPSYASIH